MEEGPEKDLDWVRDIIIRQHCGDTLKDKAPPSLQEAKEALQILIQLAEQDEKKVVNFLMSPLLPEHEKQKYIVKPDPNSTKKNVEYYNDGDIVGQRFHRFQGVADEELRQLNEKLNLDILNANIVAKLNEKFNLLTGRGQFVEIKKKLDGLYESAQLASSETEFREAHTAIVTQIEKFVDEGHRDIIKEWLREDGAYGDLNNSTKMGQGYTLDQNIIERLNKLDPDNFTYQAEISVKQDSLDLPSRPPIIDAAISGTEINLVVAIETLEEELNKSSKNLPAIKRSHQLFNLYFKEFSEKLDDEQKRQFMKEEDHGQRIKAINKAMIQLAAQARQDNPLPNQTNTDFNKQQDLKHQKRLKEKEKKKEKAKENQNNRIIIARIDSTIEALEYELKDPENMDRNLVTALHEDLVKDIDELQEQLNDQEKRNLMQDENNRGKRLKAINKEILNLNKQHNIPEQLKPSEQANVSKNLKTMSEMFSNYDNAVKQHQRSKAQKLLINTVKKIGRKNPITNKGKKRKEQIKHIQDMFDDFAKDPLSNTKEKIESAYVLLDSIRDEINAENNMVSSNLEKLCGDTMMDLEKMAEDLNIKIDTKIINFANEESEPEIPKRNRRKNM